MNDTVGLRANEGNHFGESGAVRGGRSQEKVMVSAGGVATAGTSAGTFGAELVEASGASTRDRVVEHSREAGAPPAHSAFGAGNSQNVGPVTHKKRETSRPLVHGGQHFICGWDLLGARHHQRNSNEGGLKQHRDHSDCE
jgi:hypothetical protein